MCKTVKSVVGGIVDLGNAVTVPEYGYGSSTRNRTVNHIFLVPFDETGDWPASDRILHDFADRLAKYVGVGCAIQGNDTARPEISA